MADLSREERLWWARFIRAVKGCPPSLRVRVDEFGDLALSRRDPDGDEPTIEQATNVSNAAVVGSVAQGSSCL